MGDNWNPAVNKMNDEAKKGQAPKDITHVDQATLNIGDSRAHAHFKHGHALKDDGTWKHGGKKLSGKEEAWLEKHGWKLP